ncbi:MAG: hypothetical protein BWZ10_02312 [candidate division BRC1 bacterium ADurb.BinA364]|nr:MAG: hypothetical protein BWZ10_02312 [candidate division BRC1 bacterium ADurb.BinA364]
MVHRSRKRALCRLAVPPSCYRQNLQGFDSQRLRLVQRAGGIAFSFRSDRRKRGLFAIHSHRRRGLYARDAAGRGAAVRICEKWRAPAGQRAGDVPRRRTGDDRRSVRNGVFRLVAFHQHLCADAAGRAGRGPAGHRLDRLRSSLPYQARGGPAAGGDGLSLHRGKGFSHDVAPPWPSGSGFAVSRSDDPRLRRRPGDGAGDAVGSRVLQQWLPRRAEFPEESAEAADRAGEALARSRCASLGRDDFNSAARAAGDSSAGFPRQPHLAGRASLGCRGCPCSSGCQAAPAGGKGSFARLSGARAGGA